MMFRGFSKWGINSRKTKCINDHLFDKKNTYNTPDGKRKCKTCVNISKQKYNKNNKEKIHEYNQKYHLKKLSIKGGM